MKGGFSRGLGKQLGADRVLEPHGSLPQPAERLDPTRPVRPHEIEVAVDRLSVDSTSHRNIRERAGGDPRRMAERILEIVELRGKMHNPETGSGGVLLGTVAAVGDSYVSPPAVGERIVTLGSLTLTPLRLEAVTNVDLDSSQVEVTGTAYVSGRAPWTRLPDDLPLSVALDLFDVSAAAPQTSALAPVDGTVCVLGVGHAGQLVLAAARDAMDGGTVVAVDVDPEAVQRAMAAGLCDIGVTTDLRDPLDALTAVQAAGAPAADLTVVVVNVAGCEPTAILLTTEGGAVLFFSMATNFSHAALAADGLASDIRMVIGSGYSRDRGAYALDLMRRTSGLREAYGVAVVEPAP